MANNGMHGIHGTSWNSMECMETMEFMESMESVFGNVFSESRVWKSVFGKACWKVAFGKPLLENHVWMIVAFRRSCLEKCIGKPLLWKTAFGKYQTNARNDQQSARND